MPICRRIITAIIAALSPAFITRNNLMKVSHFSVLGVETSCLDRPNTPINTALATVAVAVIIALPMIGSSVLHTSDASDVASRWCDPVKSTDQWGAGCLG